MSWDNQHDCGCHHRHDDDCCKKRCHHHDSSCDGGCKSHRRSVILQCKCFEVKRSHCGACSHMFGHNW